MLHRTPAFERPDVDAGLLSIVLPFTDGSGLAGIGIFAFTPEDAMTVMDADPGIFTYDVHPVRGFPGAALP